LLIIQVGGNRAGGRGSGGSGCYGSRNAINGRNHAHGSRTARRSVHDCRSSHHLVVIGLRNDAFGEKEFRKPLIGIAGRRCLTDLRNFFWSENSLCLENMDERASRLRISCLLLGGCRSSPRQSYSEKHDEIHHYPTLFPEHYEYPPVTHNRCVGQVINHERAPNAPYLILLSGRCQEILWGIGRKLKFDRCKAKYW